MKEKKKKKGLARLMEIAGQRKGLLIVAGTLSALSSACMLVPKKSPRVGCKSLSYCPKRNANVCMVAPYIYK